MKKVLVFVLMFVMVLSCGVVALAVNKSEVAPPTSKDATAPLPKSKSLESDSGLEYYDKEDNLLGTVPKEQVVVAAVDQANQLPAADKEAFLKVYEDVKAIKDRVVKQFFWLNTKDFEEPDNLEYYKWEFTCEGENVAVTVNGKDMEVVNVEGANYFAKLTELGAVAILCD